MSVEKSERNRDRWAYVQKVRCGMIHPGNRGRCPRCKPQSKWSIGIVHHRVQRWVVGVTPSLGTCTVVKIPQTLRVEVQQTLTNNRFTITTIIAEDLKTPNIEISGVVQPSPDNKFIIATGGEN